MKQVYIFTLIAFFSISAENLKAQTTWIGADLTFTKTANADWTLEANQDRLTNNVWFTRQNNKQLYNYKWWQDNFSADATGEDLSFDFWGSDFNGTVSQTFTATGGTKGVKWAILDDTGSTSDWSGFSFYGVLGNSNNFYSFHNIASIISRLEDGNSVTSIDDDFNINGETFGSITQMSELVGKKLGVWIVAENIYFTLTFNTWGHGGSGGAISYTRSTNQTLSANEFKLEHNIKLYPNPSSELIQVSGLKGNENYKIYNILGAEIKNGTISNNEQIDIRNFTNGLYFLKFDNGNSIKFIKQ